MTYALNVLGDKPQALWMMESSEIAYAVPAALVPGMPLVPTSGLEPGGQYILYPDTITPDDGLEPSGATLFSAAQTPGTTLVPTDSLTPGMRRATSDSGVRFVDSGPYRRLALSPNVLGEGASVVADAYRSTEVLNASPAAFDSPVFLRGHETRPFSLEAWIVVTPKTTTSPQAILSHTDQYDGLTIDGTVVSFTTKYSTAGECTASYDLQTHRAVHVVGVHTIQQNQLYVNGELVATASITDEQELDVFVINADDALLSGQSTSDKRIAVNAVALYSYGLSSEQVLNHFTWGRRVVDPESVIAPYGGYRLIMEPELLSIQVWDEKDDWKEGEKDHVIIHDGLYPITNGNDDTTQPGNWLGSVSFDAATTISEVVFDWDGSGILIQASLDDISWVNVEKGRSIPLAPTITDELSVKVSFPGGITADPSYLASLTVYIYESTGSPTVANRDITATGAVFRPLAQPIEYDDNAGIYLEGELVIGIDETPTPLPTRTVEFWAKSDTGSIDIDVTGDIFINGEDGENIFPVGKWQLFHVVAPANITAPITIATTGIISNIVLYEDALTPTQINTIYRSYTGIPSIVVTESDTFGVSIPVEAITLYDHDWAISGAGG